MLDEEGYPDPETLYRIRAWPIEDEYKDLLKFVADNWYYPDYFRRRGKTYRISTGGWSGNEEIIVALKQNTLFWLFCWYSSRRGGHYVFKIPTNIK